MLSVTGVSDFNFLWIPYMLSPKFPFITPTTSLASCPSCTNSLWRFARDLILDVAEGLTSNFLERLCNKSFVDKIILAQFNLSPVCKSVIAHTMVQCAWDLHRELQGHDLKETVALLSRESYLLKTEYANWLSLHGRW